jgi:hypothetical protein
MHHLYAFVCKRWAIEPELFRLNPLQKMPTKRLALWPGEHLPVVHSAAQAQQLASFFNLGRSMTGF